MWVQVWTTKWFLMVHASSTFESGLRLRPLWSGAVSQGPEAAEALSGRLGVKPEVSLTDGHFTVTNPRRQLHADDAVKR